MSIFDLDYDPLTGKKKKTDAQKTREALTPAKKRRVMEAVGHKCEIRGCKSKAYEVHHIKPVSKKGTNVGSNLIVLCANHHRDAHNGAVTQAKLKNVVKSRSKNVTQEINNILRNRKKVGSEKTTSSSDIPPPFGLPSFSPPKVNVPSFSPPTFNPLSFDSPFDIAPKKKGRKKKKGQ